MTAYRAIVTVKNADEALIELGGLTLLERNLKLLKQNEFEVTLVAPASSGRFQLLCQNLKISYREHLNEPLKGAYLEVLGESYYRRSFFGGLKAAIESDKSKKHCFSLSDGSVIPVVWHSGNSLESNSHVFSRNNYRDVHALVFKHSTQTIQKWLSKDIFDEIYEGTEGWVARGINKKISFPITRMLVKTNITPNQITVFCFLMGLAGCFALLSGDWLFRVLGAVALQFASILDGCDGEVAKVKIKSSRLGAWMDTIADDVLNNVMLVCLYIGYLAEYPSMALLKFCILTTVASVGVSFFLYHFMITHNDPNAGHYYPSWQNGPSSVSTSKSTFDWVKPLLKRDFFIFVVMVLMILDLRLTLIWLFVPVWFAFFLYLASFVLGLFNPQGGLQSKSREFTPVK